VEVRAAEDADAAATAAILCEVDDARVLSAAGCLHRRHGSPARERALHLVATVDHVVVGVGACGLNAATSARGVAWCSVAVTETHRRKGIGSALLNALLSHLSSLDASKATSFMRFSEEESVGPRGGAGRGCSQAR